MEKHISLLGILFICFHTVAFLGAVIAVLLSFGLGILNATALREFSITPLFPMGWLMIVGLGIGALLFLLAIPGIIAGIGLLKFRPWARILGIFIAIFHLFNFPLGTGLAFYAFWILLSPESERILKNR